jgi:rhodanese-related sulfurtransferase
MTTNVGAAPNPRGVDSIESQNWVLKDLKTTFIVDVRTRAEYEFVGHPDTPIGVANIPYMFYAGWTPNKNFINDVTAQFKKTDRLILMCRSGQRAHHAASTLMKAGFENIYYMTDSFEGPKDKDGYRTVSGWKVRKLPYTYKLQDDLIYK